MKTVCFVDFILGLQICTALTITTSSQWENLTIPFFHPANPTSCSRCIVNYNVFEFMWHTQVYTHLAKTVKLIVDNGTNFTETSTIQGPTFQLPSSATADAMIVSGSIYTVTVGSGIYTLTYPTSYFGVNSVCTTDYITTTNNASRVVCMESVKTFTDGFLQVPNGPRLSDYYSSFDKGNCTQEMESPPRVLVQVSGLTTTSTEFGTVRRQSKTPASPSILPALPIIEPTRSATESLSNLSKTKLSPENSQGTISDVQSTSTKAAPSFKESLITSVPLPSVSSIVPTVLNSALPSSSAEVSVFLSPNLLESIHPNLDPTTNTANTVPQFLIVGTIVSPHGSPISVSVATISFEPFGLLDIGLSSALIAQTNLPTISGAYIFNGQSLNPGSSPITVSGTPISLAPSATALIVGSSTVSVKLISQSFPVRVVEKSTITTNSAFALIIGPTTLPVIVVTSQSLPIIVFEGSTITPDSASQYIVGSQTLSPGTSDITVSGIHVSLAPSESFAVAGTKTIVPTTSSGLGAIIINGLRSSENASVFTGSAESRKAIVGSGCLYGFALLGLTVILQCFLN